MRRLAIGAGIALFLLHHDFWWWGDRSVVWGFLPVGLAYHAAFSLAAALLWAFCSRYTWPHEVERWAEGGEAEASSGGAESPDAGTT